MAKIARISGEHVKEQLSIYFTRVEVWLKSVRLAMKSDEKNFFRKAPAFFSVECIDGDEVANIYKTCNFSVNFFSPHPDALNFFHRILLVAVKNFLSPLKR